MDRPVEQAALARGDYLAHPGSWPHNQARWTGDGRTLHQRTVGLAEHALPFPLVARVFQLDSDGVPRAPLPGGTLAFSHLDAWGAVTGLLPAPGEPASTSELDAHGQGWGAWTLGPVLPPPPFVRDWPEVSAGAALDLEETLLSFDEDQQTVGLIAPLSIAQLIEIDVDAAGTNAIEFYADVLFAPTQFLQETFRNLVEGSSSKLRIDQNLGFRIWVESSLATQLNYIPSNEVLVISDSSTLDPITVTATVTDVDADCKLLGLFGLNFGGTPIAQSIDYKNLEPDGVATVCVDRWKQDASSPNTGAGPIVFDQPVNLGNGLSEILVHEVCHTVGLVEGPITSNGELHGQTSPHNSQRSGAPDNGRKLMDAGSGIQEFISGREILPENKRYLLRILP